jgi:hypothetical protein
LLCASFAQHRAGSAIAFDIRHTPETLRAAYAARWQRRYRRPLYIAGVIGAGGLLVMFLMRAAPWPAVALTNASVLVMAFLDSIPANAVRIALLQLDVLGSEPLRYEIGESALREQSALGNIEVHWAAFDGLEDLEPCLLLRRKPRDAEIFIIFPRDQLPPEARALLVARFEQARPASIK